MRISDWSSDVCSSDLLLQDGDDSATLVLYGDVPLVQAATLQGLLDARAGGMAVLTENLSDPSGYGRIVRDGSGQVQRIVEHKAATEDRQSVVAGKSGSERLAHGGRRTIKKKKK